MEQHSFSGATVEIYRLEEAFPADLREFFAAHAAPNIELRLEWFELLGRHVPSLAAAARLMLLRNPNGLLACWPVQLGAEAGALGNYFTALYEPVHAPGITAADLQPLVRTLRRACRDVGMMRFGPMDPASASFALLQQALRGGGWVASRFFRFGNWYLPTQQLNWEEFLSQRPGILRSTIKRMGRRFAQAGGHVEIVSGGERLEPAIAAYARVYAASWKHDEPLAEFVFGLVRQSAAFGQLRFAVAWLGETPIAAQIWLVGFGRAEIFKLAYDDNFKRFSAGTLLTATLLEHVITKDKVAEVDYLIGDDPYKATWMSHRRERWGLVVFDLKTWRGLFGLIRHRASGWLK
jgi:Acetyltransferase (GNAT) domain